MHDTNTAPSRRVIAAGTLLLLASVAAAAPIAGQSPARAWRLVRDVSIPADGSGYSLSQVAGIALRGDGAIAVADRGERHVLLFDATGHFLRTIGRAGQGPGEFGVAPYPEFRGDSLVASDWQLGRLTVFAPDGRVARTIPLDARGSPRLLPDGSVEIVALRPVRGGDSPPLVVMRRRVTRAGTLAARVDTTLVLSPGGRSLRVDLGGSTIVGVQPLDDNPLSVGLPGGGRLAVRRETSGPAVVRVLRLGIRGDTVWTRRLRYEPRPVSHDVIDAALARTTSGGPGADPALRERYRAALFVPPHLPPVTAVLPGADGTIWLRREQPAAGESAKWTVLDPRGAVLGRVAMPAGTTPMAARRDALWAVEEDADGLPILVRYRVMPGR